MKITFIKVKHIYKEDNKSRFKHFELIDYLDSQYHFILIKEIKNLNKLTGDIIEDLVNKIPDELLIELHEKYIVYYLKKRRDILLNYL